MDTADYETTIKTEGVTSADSLEVTLENAEPHIEDHLTIIKTEVDTFPVDHIDGFIKAPRNRGVPDYGLVKLQEDQVDHEVVMLMNEEELSTYLPQYGDSVFARNCLDVVDRPESVKDMKEKLINRMRQKTKLQEARMERSVYNIGNKNAERKTRQMELGWLHYQAFCYKQVRRPLGGGTRIINVKKDDTVSNIMDIGKNLFFPNGISKKGRLVDMDIMVSLLGTYEPLQPDLTVRNLFDQTQHKHLRLYICSKPKVSDHCPNRSMPSTSADSPYRHSASTHTLESPCLLLGPPDNRHKSPVFFSSNSQDCVDDLNETLIHSPFQIKTKSSGEVLLDTTIQQSQEFSPLPEVVYQHSSGSRSNCVTRTICEDQTNVAEKQTIPIHCSNILSDMVKAFTDENILHATIMFKRLLENGEEESAVGKAVIQDCLTDFWNQFYERRTSGTTFKIPTLHYCYQEKEWKAIARIFAYGWRFGYLPVQLAPPFLVEVLTLPPKESSLMDTFFNYISQPEKDILTEGLNDFNNADIEEIISVLSGHNCSTMPTEQNFSRLLEEIACKELLQQPAYIINCWKPILREVGDCVRVKGFERILSDLKPNARKVAKFIKLPANMSLQEATTSSYLLRFIRERDDKALSLFLRYCTGSDLFLSKPISVTFREMSNFERHPLAHTCSCELELASNYSSYIDFRAEFSQVLNSAFG
ncbi:uncharacterized protein LOC128659724 [Bombina bombina]|uniref:uncharacterized protein LOC128659724 n=1 Tax=Bombina bombina TaxID=8345 RepID=UPI00235B2866|nr:uncharacterized protein LOC128659724 [Bombina bombina]